MPELNHVYTFKGSRYYHTADCTCPSGEETIEELTLEEAEQKGLFPCEKCCSPYKLNYDNSGFKKYDVEKILFDIRQSVDTIKNLCLFSFCAGIIAAIICLIGLIKIS